MSHRVRKFGTKKIKVREVLDKNLKMFECEAKTLNKRRSFHFSPHQIKFSSSWICSRLLFLLLLFFNKKRLNERFVYQLSQPPPCLAPSARLPSMCYVWVSWMENRNGRLQRCPSLDQSLLTWLWQPPFRLFILPLLLLLRLIGTAVRAVEGSACKAAALARAAR